MDTRPLNRMCELAGTSSSTPVTCTSMMPSHFIMRPIGSVSPKYLRASSCRARCCRAARAPWPRRLRQAVTVQVEDRAVHQVEPLLGEELRGAGAAVVLQRMLGDLEVEPAAIGLTSSGWTCMSVGLRPKNMLLLSSALSSSISMLPDPVHPVGLGNEGIVAALMARRRSPAQSRLRRYCI